VNGIGGIWKGGTQMSNAMKGDSPIRERCHRTDHVVTLIDASKGLHEREID